MADDTWSSRDLPILEAIRRLELAAPHGRPAARDIDAVAAEADIASDDAQRAIADLLEAEYITGNDTRSMGGRMYSVLGIRLTERGRRAVGQWPSEDTFYEFLAAVQGQIEETDDPVERSKLQRLSATAMDVGKDVGTALLTAWVRSQAGMS